MTPEDSLAGETEKSPAYLNERRPNGILQDLPSTVKISKIFRQVERSTETNLLDDLSKSLSQFNLFNENV